MERNFGKLVVRERKGAGTIIDLCFLGDPSRIAPPRIRSKTAPNKLSNSLDQGLNIDQDFKGLAYNRKLPDSKQVRRRGQTTNMDKFVSLSNHSLISVISEPTRRSCSDMSTQTDFNVTEQLRTAGMPRALETRLDSAGNLSRIPRPLIYRSNTLDGTSSSKLRKTNSGSNDNPGITREKSDLSARPVSRREKSDLTGRHSKSKQSGNGYAGSPSTRRASKQIFFIFFKSF